MVGKSNIFKFRLFPSRPATLPLAAGPGDGAPTMRVVPMGVAVMRSSPARLGTCRTPCPRLAAVASIATAALRDRLTRRGWVRQLVATSAAAASSREA